MPSLFFKSPTQSKLIHYQDLKTRLIYSMSILLLFLIPFWMSTQLVTLSWILAAIIFYLISFNKAQLLPLALSILFLCLSVFGFIIDSHWLSGILITAFILINVFQLVSYQQSSKLRASLTYFICIAGIGWIIYILPYFNTFYDQAMIPLGMGLTAAIAAFIIYFKDKVNLSLNLITFILFGSLLIYLYLYSIRYSHPFTFLGLFAWLSLMIVSYISLNYAKQISHSSKEIYHAVAGLIIVTLLTWESLYQVLYVLKIENNALIMMAKAIVPSFALILLLGIKRFALQPFNTYYRGYYWLGAGTIAIYLWCWSLIASMTEVQFGSWFLMNAINICQAGVLLLLLTWILSCRKIMSNKQYKLGLIAWAAGLILTIQACGLRVFSLVGGETYNMSVLLQDEAVLSAVIGLWIVGIIIGIIFLKNKLNHV